MLVNLQQVVAHSIQLETGSVLAPFEDTPPMKIKTHRFKHAQYKSTMSALCSEGMLAPFICWPSRNPHRDNM